MPESNYSFPISVASAFFGNRLKRETAHGLPDAVAPASSGVSTDPRAAPTVRSATRLYRDRRGFPRRGDHEACVEQADMPLGRLAVAVKLGIADHGLLAPRDEVPLQSMVSSVSRRTKSPDLATNLMNLPVEAGATSSKGTARHSYGRSVLLVMLVVLPVFSTGLATHAVAPLCGAEDFQTRGCLDTATGPLFPLERRGWPKHERNRQVQEPVIGARKTPDIFIFRSLLSKSYVRAEFCSRWSSPRIWVVRIFLFTNWARTLASAGTLVQHRRGSNVLCARLGPGAIEFGLPAAPVLKGIKVSRCRAATSCRDS